ncbi:MAG: hypothetical protein R3D29_05375 [Nitratireductor sp.]
MDYCAGGGGKTLAMAAMMDNRGQIHAHDTDRNRLAPIHERIKRAGVRNAQVLVPCADHSALEGRMDCVLVDAPCTGSGTWRRRPDAKWRLSADNLAERVAEQDQVLAQAARFVRPVRAAGLCHLLDVCDREHASCRGVSRKQPRISTPAACRFLGEMCENAHFTTIANTMVALSPLKTGTDGFFIAGFQRSNP